MNIQSERFGISFDSGQVTAIGKDKRTGTCYAIVQFHFSKMFIPITESQVVEIQKDQFEWELELEQRR